MFFSIKFKILISIALIMTLTAGANIYFTHRDVGQAMLSSQREAAEKMLAYVRLNTEDEYRSLLRAKMEMTLEKRGQLKEAALLALSVLKSFNKFEEETGKTGAEKWIQTIPFKNIHYLLLNRETRVMATSSPRFTSKIFQTLTDVKGRNLAGTMAWDKISARGDYAVVNLGEKQILTYFVPFPTWQCTLATILDINDIEAEAEKKLARIITSLEASARELVMIKGGYAFMFTGKKTFIISPPEALAQGLAEGVNTQTGHPILADMMTAATQNPEKNKEDQKLIHISSLDPQQEEMATSISYFKPLDWYIGVTVPVREIQRPARDLVIRQSTLIAVMLALGLLIIGFMVSRIASPLRALAAHAKKLPNQDFTAESGTAVSIQERVLRSRDEVGELARSFGFMESELRKNISNLVEITAARERIQGELNVAREIQMGIIPKTFPTFPDHNQFDLFATIKPAKEVGGDLYDFFLLDPDHVCFTLGDVSDKGVPAALFMVITRTLIKTTAEHERSPARIMSRINTILEADNPRAMFVTLIIGVLNIRTGALTYSSGGHNHPILVEKNGSINYKTDKSGPMVGVIADFDYREISVDLLPGDGFFLYTDGVTEAMDKEQHLFSDGKLLETVQNGPLDRLEATIENVMEKVVDHAGDAPQSDDIAMLMIRYNG
ncbi:predicted phosphoserine phosphatase RsbU (Sigma factor regulation protein RsbU) [Desulforapulum autotrophicum HRM2]|uniref:Predicted phosphoserine phosphatase RsbU (Sigma factor regulation protein RsbU) n=1 Tax=Desulforapulum autotrophicum (strain ATCC 43914 / DSM 3382 / VKM B-1955 / HRM2) TaxID=177437 RepID=C0QFD6_DESAH|nr:SpoIIE family protein phosphatase [Desulforapulum autotrophicum]ACN13332.1 predicted phosphoserine phosphatase RsbU (Sigma factor regulation protein RsbU) [Desulforapulum autotrophicum HRM2]